MSIRRSSGEVINATLLEVFLSFVFVVLALAVFERNKALNAETKASALEGLSAAQVDSLNTFRQLLDSLSGLHASQMVPFCDSTVLFQARVVSRSVIEVTPLQTEHGLERGNVRVLGAGRLREGLREVLEASRAGKCKYRISVVNAPGLTADDYRSVRRRLVQLFYPQEFAAGERPQ